MFGSCENGSDGSGFRFRLGSWATLKKGPFDEIGKHDKFAFYPPKTRASLLRPPKTTKMTKMSEVSKRGWREGVGNKREPKAQRKLIPRIVFPFS